MSNLSDTIKKLRQISERLGVSLTELPTFKPVVITGTISEMVKSGKIQKVRDNEIIRTDLGEVLFLYIPDLSYLTRQTRSGKPIRDIPENRNKIHLCYCETLQTMERQSRSYRYCATNKHTGKFPVKYDDKDEKEVELNVCKHCLKLLNTDKFGQYSNFNFKEFYQHHCYAVPWFEGVPKVLYGVEYPPNWKQLSYQIRAERDWKCEKCGRDCSKQKYMLDLHHINGVKSDCSRSNLKALCRDCHRQEPYHTHMKRAAVNKRYETP